MAPNQKTTQPKRLKTNCFLACFGFSTKTSSSSKKKPKKIDARKKFFTFKLRWPRLRVMTIEKKRFIFNPKEAALKASHDIMFEATKVHQLKRIDHHVSPIQELKVPSKEIIHHDNQNPSKIQSFCATCHKQDPATPKAVIRQSLSTNKVIKDSFIGVSIMVAMLIIMLIWGRLCAIICMSAWLYCIPLFRGDRDVKIKPNHTNTNTKLGTNNLNSELYKKKVVLQGLLQRDHKTPNGIS